MENMINADGEKTIAMHDEYDGRCMIE